MGWLFARLYDRVVRKAEEAGVRQWRHDLLGNVRGDILEIGAGTGLNLPQYSAARGRLVLTEPSGAMRAMLTKRVAALGAVDVEIVDAPAESLPVADATVDTVVATVVLCSVRDMPACLAEIWRVLRPGGVFLYCEHIASEDPRVYRWQRWIEPLWKWWADGCHLTRRTGDALLEAGFAIDSMQEEDMPAAPRWVRRTIRGVARKPAV